MQVVVKTLCRIFYNFSIVFLIYVVILTKMPWLYNVTVYPKKHNKLLEKEVCYAYSCFFKSMDDTELKLLQQKGISFNVPCDEDGNTLLHHAVMQDKEFICEWLMEHGNADLNIKNSSGLTPLDCVLWEGKTYEYLKNKGGKHSWKYYFWLMGVDK